MSKTAQSTLVNMIMIRAKIRPENSSVTHPINSIYAPKLNNLNPTFFLMN